MRRGCVTREYKAWAMMLQRCNNPNNPRYRTHGGRGISVCEAWRDFAAFYADMGNSNGLTLDRIDNDGNYEPGNCRWATYDQQNRNQRRNRWLTLNGETLTITDWARRLNITQTALHYRLKAGWPVDRALTTIRGIAA